MGNGGEFDEVFVALGVFGQDHLVIAGHPDPLASTVEFLFDIAINEIHLVADDRLDARPFAHLDQLDRPIHDPVVGEGDRRHPQLHRPIDQGGQLTGPIQKAVVTVDMQADEGHDAVPL